MQNWMQDRDRDPNVAKDKQEEHRPKDQSIGKIKAGTKCVWNRYIPRALLYSKIPRRFSRDQTQLIRGRAERSSRINSELIQKK